MCVIQLIHLSTLLAPVLDGNGGGGGDPLNKRSAWYNAVQKVILTFCKDCQKLTANEIHAKRIVICVECGICGILAYREYFLHVCNTVFEY